MAPPTLPLVCSAVACTSLGQNSALSCATAGAGISLRLLIVATTRNKFHSCECWWFFFALLIHTFFSCQYEQFCFNAQVQKSWVATEFTHTLALSWFNSNQSLSLPLANLAKHGWWWLGNQWGSWLQPTTQTNKQMTGAVHRFPDLRVVERKSDSPASLLNECRAVYFHRSILF
jgi:hypothetical protein